VLLYRSAVDHVVRPISAAMLRERATATHVEERVLDESYHVATLDNDAERIFAGSYEFFRQHATAPLASSDPVTR
jgi:carboxylesterase